MIAKFIANAVGSGEKRLPPRATLGVKDYVGHQIEFGENAVATAWPPG